MKKSASLHVNLADYASKAYQPYIDNCADNDNLASKSDADLSDNRSQTMRKHSSLALPGSSKHIGGKVGNSEKQTVNRI